MLGGAPVMAKEKGANYGVSIQDALRKRGIENAYQLWQKIGGSKATAAILWEGSARLLHMDIVNKLANVLGIRPGEYLVDKE
jgi:DNA-binding Xre family transcriptional regulator